MQAGIETQHIQTFHTYRLNRKSFRQQMIPLRKNLSIMLADSVRLQFETRQTVIYQIQEMVYADKLADPSRIQAQIDNYAHMITSNERISATLMMEFSGSTAEQSLKQRQGIEQSIFLQIGDTVSWVEANMDIGGKPVISPVHFLQFSFSVPWTKQLEQAGSMLVGSAGGFFPARPLPTTLIKALVG